MTNGKRRPNGTFASHSAQRPTTPPRFPPARMYSSKANSPIESTSAASKPRADRSKCNGRSPESSLNQSTFWTAKTGQKNEGSRKRPLRHQASPVQRWARRVLEPETDSVGNSTKGPFSRLAFRRIRDDNRTSQAESVQSFVLDGLSVQTCRITLAYSEKFRCPNCPTPRHARLPGHGSAPMPRPRFAPMPAAY
jgi:hypothetical protein